ncbi:hypothetical protein GF342_05485 [Candidatus Woesearchaeota archaeon]|nr:hypothetical protein [Candidatus Woesearchaeota archaeon]
MNKKLRKLVEIVEQDIRRLSGTKFEFDCFDFDDLPGCIQGATGHMFRDMGRAGPNSLAADYDRLTIHTTPEPVHLWKLTEGDPDWYKRTCYTISISDVCFYPTTSKQQQRSRFEIEHSRVCRRLYGLAHKKWTTYIRRSQKRKAASDFLKKRR